MGHSLNFEHCDYTTISIQNSSFDNTSALVHFKRQNHKIRQSMEKFKIWFQIIKHVFLAIKIPLCPAYWATHSEDLSGGISKSLIYFFLSRIYILKILYMVVSLKASIHAIISFENLFNLLNFFLNLSFFDIVYWPNDR